MQTNLVKLATLIAMLHMALGCAWHHGFGSPHACASGCHGSTDALDLPSTDGAPQAPIQSVASTIDRCCNHDLLTALAISDETTQEPMGRLSHDRHFPHHIACDNDRCSFTKVNGFDSDSFVLVRAYLNGSLDLMRDTRLPSPTLALGRSPVCRRLAPGMRAHLLWSVQLL